MSLLWSLRNNDCLCYKYFAPNGAAGDFPISRHSTTFFGPIKSLWTPQSISGIFCCMDEGFRSLRNKKEGGMNVQSGVPSVTRNGLPIIHKKMAQSICRRMKSNLAERGYTIWGTGISEDEILTLRREAFRTDQAGERCLLNLPMVDLVARALGRELIEAGILDRQSIAVQAIAFDKTASTNWKVTWHQDLMFPFAKRTSTAGYDLAVIKGGVDYARPPVEVLSELLAIRLHLDDCTIENGPLRVAPGTHVHGIVPSAKIAEVVSSTGQETCLASVGEALLMRPLLLHASSKATRPDHRRVLHIVYYSGNPMKEKWHRATRLTTQMSHRAGVEPNTRSSILLNHGI